MTRLALLACCTLAACSLYSNNTPPDAPCYFDPPAQQQLRDPSSGTCETISDGGGCGCGPCANGGAGVAIPAWTSCYGTCDALSETACLATAGCHAAYLDVEGGGSDLTNTFWGCWDITPLSPLEGGTCAGLDAETCIQHDDCTSAYVGPGPATAPPSTSDSFYQCSAKSTPPPPPACSTLTTLAACQARSDCEPIYDGSMCTCTPSGCTCQVETFDHCQAL